MFLLGKKPPKNNAKEFNKQQCSNPQCNNVKYDKLITPMFMTNDQFTELYGIEYTGEPFVLCRKCYNETHATFMVLMVYHAAHVELSQKKKQPLADIVHMLKKYHSIYQSRLGKI